MNILIFTGRFGMGHYSVAETVRQQLQAQSPQATIHVIDIIDKIFPDLNKYIYGFFDFSVNRCSNLYNQFAVISSRSKVAPLKRIVAERLSVLIDSYQPDMLISVIPICSQYLSSYKKIKHSCIPLYTYITDVMVYQEWVSAETNAYFVACEQTRQSLLSKGVPPEKIIITGIPVKPEFSIDNNKFNYNNKTEILVMGGGLGLIPGAYTWLADLHKVNDVHVTVITGKNKKLRDGLAGIYPNMTILGYTDKVANYMKTSDILVSKAGGITTFEAIRSGTPICTLTPFLNQESGNAEFIEKMNIGTVSKDNNKTLADDILYLARNVQVRKKMIQNEKSIINTLSGISPIDLYSNADITNHYRKKQKAIWKSIG